MSIEIKGNLKFLSEIADKLPEENARRLESFCSDAVTGIDIRARRGKNVQGQGMGQYKPSYQKYRQAAGRRGSQIGLNLTGNMLRAMTYTVRRIGTKLEAKISFNNTITTSPKNKYGGGQRYSSVDAARATQKRFRWFGLDKTQRGKLKKLFRGNNVRRR